MEEKTKFIIEFKEIGENQLKELFEHFDNKKIQFEILKSNNEYASNEDLSMEIIDKNIVIDNLLKQNKKLQEENKLLTNDMLRANDMLEKYRTINYQETINKLQDRIDKAIEYCKTNRGYVAGYGYLYEKDNEYQEIKDDILSILDKKGE